MNLEAAFEKKWDAYQSLYEIRIAKIFDSWLSDRRRNLRDNLFFAHDFAQHLDIFNVLRSREGKAVLKLKLAAALGGRVTQTEVMRTFRGVGTEAERRERDQRRKLRHKRRKLAKAAGNQREPTPPEDKWQPGDTRFASSPEEEDEEDDEDDENSPIHPQKALVATQACHYLRG
ncbi:hypothetical protein HDU86_005936 [Geranomyces michiganensis]|nr:hypothetical protein HDU86_005936 [Geranomyces michiganensis]